MKKLLFLALLAAALSGCSLIPHKVEYFQRKVKAVPELTDADKEHQRQAAEYVAKKVEETKEAAIVTHADPAVIAPVKEAGAVAQALTESLGSARREWPRAATNLVEALHQDQAKLNARLEDYSERVEKDVGKKIEGTGLIQVGYFTQAGIILGVLALLWAGLKIYGTMNPAVGLGTNIVGRVASSVVSRGFSEIVAGGERFKDYVENSPLTADVKSYVADLFTRAHMEAQSQDVQHVVTTLTKADPITTAPAAIPAPTATAIAHPGV